MDYKGRKYDEAEVLAVLLGDYFGLLYNFIFLDRNRLTIFSMKMLHSRMESSNHVGKRRCCDVFQSD